MEEEVNSFELVESRDAIELVPQQEIPIWWIAIGLGVVLAIAYVFFLRRNTAKPVDPKERARLAYDKAREALGDLGTLGVRDTAILVSAVIRRYLAEVLDEPALFETHEEFISRHDGLKDLPGELRLAAGEFFSQLAEVKYTAEVPAACDSVKIAEGGMKLLERMHAA